MQNQDSALIRHLSRLIAALHRQWLEELGTLEGHGTRSMLTRTEQLLTRIKAGENSPENPANLLEYLLNAEWHQENIWAESYFIRLNELMKTDGLN